MLQYLTWYRSVRCIQMLSQRHLLRFLPIALASGLFVASPAYATSVTVVGLFPGKAVLTIDGSAPRTIAVGAKTPEGVKLLGLDSSGATVEVDGRRQRLSIGETAASNGGASVGGAQEVNLTADSRGHFVTTGSVNGATVTLMVDTGASMVAMGLSDAQRAGIDLKNARAGYSQTANGVAQMWVVKLKSVRVGDVLLYDVDAAVMATDMPIVLLGMSFLNRMEMKRDGERMTLKRRY